MSESMLFPVVEMPAALLDPRVRADLRGLSDCLDHGPRLCSGPSLFLPPDRVPAGLDRPLDEPVVERDELQDVVPADLDHRAEGEGVEDRQRQVLDDPLVPGLLAAPGSGPP